MPPRSADIIAETNLEVLQLESSRFLSWYEERPELRDFLGALEQVYWLEGGRRRLRHGPLGIGSKVG